MYIITKVPLSDRFDNSEIDKIDKTDKIGSKIFMR